MSMLEKNQQDYLYMLRTAVRGEHLDKNRVDGMNLEEIFHTSLSQTHSVMFYQCFLDSGLKLPEKISKRCQNEMNHGIHREALMNVERERIYEFMDREGIWHCPLKGIVLQPLYPMLGMRYSADNDILIDAKGCKKLRDFMKKRGYRVLEYGGSHHDSYVKNPSYHFEFHRRLLSHLLLGNSAMKYFENIEDRLLRDEKNSFHRQLTNEDFYLHMIIHMYMHYTATGTGLRSLVDIYYYRKAYNVDDAYVRGKLEEFGIAEFEKTAVMLTGKLFDDYSEVPEGNYNTDISTSFTAQELEMLDYLFSSGACGSHEIYAANMFEQCRKRSKTMWGARIRYVWMRLFPSMDYYKIDHPTLYRFKILIPFFWIYRLFRAIFAHKPTRELTVIKGEKQE